MRQKAPADPSGRESSSRTEQLTGIQRGNTVILTWPAPIANAADSSVQSIRRIDVYRLAESPTAPLPLTEQNSTHDQRLLGQSLIAQYSQHTIP